MSATWRVAAVQMDCKLGERETNLATIRAKLDEAADNGAKLIVFPECALTGYGFTDRAATTACAEPMPGPSTDAIANLCAKRNVWAVYGLIEKAGAKLYNSCALAGPSGFVATYRKVHLPCVGADRFTDPGDQPFAIHDIGGLKIGINICFDGSFPESSRIMTLQGADLVVLPTNWADKALRMATLVPRVRAFENHIYYMAVNRIGMETGYHYIGHSSITDYLGDYMAYADHDGDVILYASLDPAAARQKKLVHCVGEYEIDRVNWRRPELYGDLTTPQPTLFTGHQNK